MKSTIRRKLQSILRKLIAIPFVLIVVLLKPFFHIRFGIIRSDRIGHFVGDIEAYLCMRDNNQFSAKEIHLIGCPIPVCNKQILIMWRRVFSIMPFPNLLRLMDEACLFWTGSKNHHLQLAELLDHYYLIHDGTQHLKFNQFELKNGQQILQALGVPKGVPWICLHNRDPSYIDLTWNTRKSYHDYRNFKVQSLSKAAEELTRRGFYVIRLGSIVEDEFKTQNIKIIDYSSSSHKSHFMDAFLLGNCYAYIGSDSGISDIPFAFHKPVSYVNFSSTLIETIIKRKITIPFIFKRLRMRSTGDFISMRQMYDLGLENACLTEQFQDAGIELVDNTSDEIHDLAIEVVERISGNWVDSEVDKNLQSLFWETLENCTNSRISAKNVTASVGSAFLRKNQYLLA